jgi:hypothetical protein
MAEFLTNNKEWVFSGFGAAVFTLVGSLILRLLRKRSVALRLPPGNIILETSLRGLTILIKGSSYTTFRGLWAWYGESDGGLDQLCKVLPI